MNQELLNARLVNSAMKLYELKQQAAGSKSLTNKERNGIYIRLRNGEREFFQACENYKKSGCQP